MGVLVHAMRRPSNTGERADVVIKLTAHKVAMSPQKQRKGSNQKKTAFLQDSSKSKFTMTRNVQALHKTIEKNALRTRCLFVVKSFCNRFAIVL